MYKRECFKYDDNYKTETGKKLVLDYFLQDIACCGKPSYHRTTKTLFYCTFGKWEDKYRTKYILPVKYAILVNDENGGE